MSHSLRRFRAVLIASCLASSCFLAVEPACWLAAQESAAPAASPAIQKSPLEARSPADQKLSEERRLNNEESALKRKTELLAFAESHDPQLRALLLMLETKRPKQFRQALASLARDMERLSGLQTRDPERHALELQQWKNSQRIQILSARLAIQGKNPDAKEELKKLLVRRTEIRQELLQLELQRARERVARLEEQAGQLAEPTDSELEKQLEQILARGKKFGNGTAPNPSADANRGNKGDRE